jgi:hypothetical protein
MKVKTTMRKVVKSYRDAALPERLVRSCLVKRSSVVPTTLSPSVPITPHSKSFETTVTLTIALNPPRHTVRLDMSCHNDLSTTWNARFLQRHGKPTRHSRSLA